MIDFIKRRLEILKEALDRVNLNLEKFLEQKIDSYSYQSFLDDVCLKFKYKKKEPLITRSYSLIKHLKQKIIKTTNAKIEPKKTYLNLKINLKKDKNVIQFKDCFIGKTQIGNQKVYESTRNGGYTYFHAMVRGGGLIACKDENLGSSLALVYSKHLKVNGSTEGFVSVSKDIVTGPKRGSFFFRNSKLIKTKVKITWYLGINEKEMVIDPLNNQLPYKISFFPSNNHRFNQLKSLTSKSINNLNELESLVPLRWDLKVNDRS